MKVPMEFSECEVCPNFEPTGITCGGCGHHFHVGSAHAVNAESISCPRCEGSSTPDAIAGTAPTPSHIAIVDLVCGEVEPEVAERVRTVAKTRTSSDPTYWGNVMLRESWYVEHGSYDGWDESARAMGADPLEFGPVAAQ